MSLRLLCFCLLGLMLPDAGRTAPAQRFPLAQGPNNLHAGDEISATKLIHVGDATIQVDFAAGELDVPQEQVMQWVRAAVNAVSVYYGRFPVKRALVLVVPVAEERGIHGTTWGNVHDFPAFTRMQVGQHTTQQELAKDWTMTHELVHTAFPSLAEKHHWLEEGLATYIEPIARVQAGQLAAQQIWGDMARDMPKGQPEPSDHGLDRTRDWASTYWGGALFCLTADVDIRKATGNRKGLQDALRAIVEAGGTIDQEWPIAKALAVGDHATGTSVLADLYRTMGDSPRAPMDLQALWQQLGVASRDGQTVLNDHAPLAEIRKQITSAR